MVMNRKAVWKKAAEAEKAFLLLALKCRRIHGLKPNLVDFASADTV
jgi:hypothetical protein